VYLIEKEVVLHRHELCTFVFCSGARNMVRHPLCSLQYVSTQMSNHQANFEPLNSFEFLPTVLFISKAADPCVTSGWPSVLVQLSLPAGVNNIPQLSSYSS
jgi:hypothetical protein